MKVDPVGSPQEGGNTFIEQIGHCRWESGEDQADGQTVANEVLQLAASWEISILSTAWISSMVMTRPVPWASSSRSSSFPVRRQSGIRYWGSWVAIPNPAAEKPVILRVGGPSPNSSSRRSMSSPNRARKPGLAVRETTAQPWFLAIASAALNMMVA
ncbi:hypothetical protein AAIH25_20635 [Arthrobacter crystallopoietes]|uniref:hypothetical protein n=1 Tax=Crystallibacter crystallopoietes TaxID=37928 RepID=UPI003D1CBE7D